MAENKNIEVGGRLHSIATGNVLAGANEVLDDAKGKKQSVINAENDIQLASHESRLNAYTEGKFVTVNTYSELPATGVVDTVYRVSSWDGTANNGQGAVDVTKYSEYAWQNGAYKFLDVKTQIGEVFDISEYNSGAVYTDLANALGNNGINVPSSIRRGGMSVKFKQVITPAAYTVVKTEGATEQPTGTEIQSDPGIISGTYTAGELSVFSTLPATLNSSLTYYLTVTETVDEQEVTTYTTWVITYVRTYDNKYVQFRCMSDAFTTDVTKWQGVDDEPAAGSRNLIESGYVFSLQDIQLNSNITSTGVIQDYTGRFIINRYFPITEEPTVTVTDGTTNKLVVKVYYDSGLQCIGKTYSSIAKYVKIVIELNNTHTSISHADTESVIVTIDGISYRAKQGLPADKSLVDEINRAKAAESDLEGEINRAKSFLTSILLNKNISNGVLVDYDGRLVVNRYFPIDRDIKVYVTASGATIGYRYYNDSLLYLGTSYGNTAKYVKIVIELNNSNTPITQADTESILLFIDGISYKLTQYIPFAEEYLDDLKTIILNCNIASPGFMKYYTGRFVINQFFQINNDLSTNVSISKGSLIYRYYDENLNYLGSSISSSAKYFKLIVELNSTHTEITHADVEDIILTVDNVSYRTVQGLPAVQTVKDSSFSLMQIFPKYTVIGTSTVAGYTDIGGGEHISSKDARTAGNNWPTYIAKRTRVDMTNLAVGSSTAHNWRYADGPSAGNIADITEANIPTDCYIVSIGGNDYSSGNPLGSSSDIAENKDNNSDTFYGNYDWVIRKLLEYNPNAHIFCITTDPNRNASNFDEAIKYVCNLYQNQVHCIDITSLYKKEFTTGIIAGCRIGVHYNPLAYNIQSVLFERAICGFIYKNYSKFMIVPYYQGWTP